MTAAEAAKLYISNGFHPLPIPFRSKAPAIDRWQNLRIGLDDLPKYFGSGPQNIGLLLGDECGTADIDCDCLEAVGAAVELAPETAMIFGRKSKRASHYFYRSDPPIRSRKYVDPSDRKNTIVELRCQKTDGTLGLQTVVPPSAHADTGEPIEFEPGAGHQPANVDAHVLEKAAARIAAAALLVRAWPKEGARHDCFLALAGVLARTGWKVEDALVFHRAIYRALWGHKADMAGAALEVTSTFEKYQTHRVQITGIPKLIELVGRLATATALTWLGIETQKSNGKAKPKPEPEIWTAHALFSGDFPRPAAIIERLLYPGITLLQGAPKEGKSYLALQASIDLVNGWPFAGYFPVNKPHRVLYLALEDTKARTATRLKELGDYTDRLCDLQFIYSLEPWPDNIAQLDELLAKQSTDLLVVDVLRRFRMGPKDRDHDVVRGDYAAIQLIRELVDRHKASCLILSHTRKHATGLSDTDASIDSTGVSAAVDTLLTLRRRSAGATSMLSVLGRETEHAEYELEFNLSTWNGWHVLATGAEAGLTVERREIVELLKKWGPLSPKTIAEQLGKHRATIRRLLRMLLMQGVLRQDTEGNYSLAQEAQSCS